MLVAIKENANLKIIIEQDSKVGYYIFVYHLNNDELIEDRLYDTLREAFVHVEDIYGIQEREFIENNGR